MDHRAFFETLRDLSPVRVISISGASVFEAICSVGEVELAGGVLNAITPAYHWHLDLKRFREVRARDEVHARSGRRVMFFELAEEAGARPFLMIYVHREKGAEFEPTREARFKQYVATLPTSISTAAEVQS